MTLDPYSSVTDSHDFYCCVPEKNIMKVRLHDHVNSDHPTTNCCPSQQTTQRSPAVRSAQLRLVFGTVYQLPFEQHPLPALFDDTSRLIFSPATPPSTNCYHPRLRFELLFWHMARYKCRLLTYLLTCVWIGLAVFMNDLIMRSSMLRRRYAGSGPLAGRRVESAAVYRVGIDGIDGMLSSNGNTSSSSHIHCLQPFVPHWKSTFYERFFFQ